VYGVSGLDNTKGEAPRSERTESKDFEHNGNREQRLPQAFGSVL